MVTNYQNGVIAQLLQAIIGQINFDGTPTSNIGDILLSILEQTPYDKEPKSVLAELFLKLKDKLEGRAFTPYDKEPKSAIAEILLSILNETEYDKEPNSRIAELLLELKAELESYAELTASGAIANFTTSVVKPLVNLTAYFKATQETGTPTPQSPKAISGVSAVNNIHCRKNLFNLDYLTASGVTIQSGEASATALIFANAFGLNTSGIPSINFSSNKSYNVSFKAYTSGEGTTEGTGLYIAFVYADGTRDMLTIPNNQQAFDEFSKTSNANKTVSKICFGYQSGYANVWHLKDIQIEENSEATAFEPYNGSTTLINLGGTYYGGYVTQDKNGKRELIVTHGVKRFSDLDFRRSNSSGSWSSYVFFAQMSDKTIKSAVKCSHYDYVTQSIASMQNETIVSGSSNEYIYIRDDNYTDVPTFKTANANTQLWYELAEPFTVALPDGEPILAFNGVNNIYNDSGDTSVTYLAKIADNLNATAKFRAEVKTQKEKAKEELKEDVKEDVKELEPVKDSGEKKRGA